MRPVIDICDPTLNTDTVSLVGFDYTVFIDNVEKILRRLARDYYNTDLLYLIDNTDFKDNLFDKYMNIKDYLYYCYVNAMKLHLPLSPVMSEKEFREAMRDLGFVLRPTNFVDGDGKVVRVRRYTLNEGKGVLMKIVKENMRKTDK